MFFSFCFYNNGSGAFCLLLKGFFINVESLGKVWAKYLKSTC